MLLNETLLPDAVALDQRALGGLWTLNGYRQELERPSSALVGLVCNPLKSPLLGMGCLWGIEDEAHIILLAVDPDYRRQGLGQRLLWGMLEIASQRHLARATLEVRASNTGAIALYEKFGFQMAGRRPGYYTETGEDALILWLGNMQTKAFERSLQQWQQTLEQQSAQQGWQLSVAAL
ncbi:MAG: ribosomal-protein-alanine N-acetyltransferase [Chloroflexi bacterium AL-N5]|nr:ribosomal-protein-alanine N-acetyltransferase [Chloroflexi bacterium AL-N5]